MPVVGLVPATNFGHGTREFWLGPCVVRQFVSPLWEQACCNAEWRMPLGCVSRRQHIRMRTEGMSRPMR